MAPKIRGLGHGTKGRSGCQVRERKAGPDSISKVLHGGTTSLALHQTPGLARQGFCSAESLVEQGGSLIYQPQWESPPTPRENCVIQSLKSPACGVKVCRLQS